MQSVLSVTTVHWLAGRRGRRRQPVKALHSPQPLDEVETKCAPDFNQTRNIYPNVKELASLTPVGSSLSAVYPLQFWTERKISEAVPELVA